MKGNERVKKFGEVFTPNATVFKMVLSDELRDAISDVDKTFVDPAAANIILKRVHCFDSLKWIEQYYATNDARKASENYIGQLSLF